MMRPQQIWIGILAACALAACGGGGDDANAASDDAGMGTSVPTESKAEMPKGRIVTEFTQFEARGARLELFETGGMYACKYTVENPKFVFETDTANAIGASFSLTRQDDSCANEDERGDRLAGMVLDDILPPTVSVVSTRLGFKESGMDLERGDTVLSIEFTANGVTSPDELACRLYPQKGEVGMSCDIDGPKIERYEIPASPGSSNEGFRFTFKGRPQF